MHVSDLVLAMEELAPVAFAESWDNVGLLVGDPSSPLRRILLTVDLTSPVIQEALALGCDSVVSYHPPIFKSLKRIVSGDLAYEIVRANLAVYSPHTALDVASGGTNDALCDAIGALERRPLRMVQGQAAVGMGRVAKVERIEREELIARIKAKLDLKHLLVSGPVTAGVDRVAVCAGAGGSLLDDAIASGANVFLVGELSHHDALRAARAGVCVIATLHSNAERLALPPLASKLSRMLKGIDVHVSRVDGDPFAVW